MFNVRLSDGYMSSRVLEVREATYVQEEDVLLDGHTDPNDIVRRSVVRLVHTNGTQEKVVLKKGMVFSILDRDMRPAVVFGPAIGDSE